MSMWIIDKLLLLSIYLYATYEAFMLTPFPFHFLTVSHN
ncbi:hypothetical protein F383_10954 [Gossypium arboreum]|uniref:Uncharacterized protein n=1 Tax=Gossypium arboreum TaxID=29729 RepID=A0A0B0NEX1_GOSAR|nr:hypothetical protein F383_10954 [Gossypium arboreum]